MKTRIIKIDGTDFDPGVLLPAARALSEGRLVVFPTETVYGLGANAVDPLAVGKIFKAKGRPADNPLIVHISRMEQIDPLVISIPEKAKALMKTFWPGPLTLILEKSDKVPPEVTAGLPTVAIRMPDNKAALRLIDLAGVPVAAPSANLSGRPSPTDAEHVIQDLAGRVDFIIDGGSSAIGLESTVIDMTSDPPVVLRPGGVTPDMIERVIGTVNVDKIIVRSGNDVPKSPGMKYRHYSPKADMTIVSGETDRVVSEINRMTGEAAGKNLKTGVLASRETCGRYEAPVVLSPGSVEKPEDIAAAIFSCLREFDDKGVGVIFSESFSEEGIGLAIMNRLKKAAGGKIIEV